MDIREMLMVDGWWMVCGRWDSIGFSEWVDGGLDQCMDVFFDGAWNDGRLVHAPWIGFIKVRIIDANISE